MGNWATEQHARRVALHNSEKWFRLAKEKGEWRRKSGRAILGQGVRRARWVFAHATRGDLAANSDAARYGVRRTYKSEEWSRLAKQEEGGRQWPLMRLRLGSGKASWAGV